MLLKDPVIEEIKQIVLAVELRHDLTFVNIAKREINGGFSQSIYEKDPHHS